MDMTAYDSTDKEAIGESTGNQLIRRANRPMTTRMTTSPLSLEAAERTQNRVNVSPTSCTKGLASALDLAVRGVLVCGGLKTGSLSSQIATSRGGHIL